MIEIVVADQGWVFIGRTSDSFKDLDFGYQIKNALCIRVWGTKKGLGQLRWGPTENTICDYMGTLHVKNVLFTMQVNQDAWEKWIEDSST